MEITSLTPGSKDPVAHPKEEIEIQNAGAIQPLKNDEHAQQQSSTPEDTSLSLHIQHQPLHLLLGAIIARLSEALRIEHAPSAAPIPGTYGLTPESVASRSVNIAINAYTSQSAVEQTRPLSDFVVEARRAIDAGFQEAQTLLQQLGGYHTDVAVLYNRVRELIQLRLQEWQQHNVAAQ